MPAALAEPQSPSTANLNGVVEPAGRCVLNCGEGFETSADASAGPCKYVEDCQVCCQPIEMELRVDGDGNFEELLLRRGDS